jgi:hypothetical protein
MRNLNEFKTIDGTSIRDSLTKHGLIVQNHKSDSYLCLYRHDTAFELGFATESEISDLLNGKSWVDQKQIKKFYSDLNLERETFINLPFIYKLHSMMKYFGVTDIMGKKVYEMTLDDALREYWHAMR